MIFHKYTNIKKLFNIKCCLITYSESRGYILMLMSRSLSLFNVVPGLYTQWTELNLELPINQFAYYIIPMCVFLKILYYQFALI